MLEISDFEIRQNQVEGGDDQAVDQVISACRASPF
jgi:hypothetical protein